MNITKFAIEKKTLTYFSVFLFTVIGIVSFFKLGQLEDPDFAVKMAVITCQYPGATPEEVAPGHFFKSSSGCHCSCHLCRKF